MGSPISQPARVVFDTGSEYLAITSVLCDDETAGNFKFKKYVNIEHTNSAGSQSDFVRKSASLEVHYS